MKRIMHVSSLSARSAVGDGILVGIAAVRTGLLATGSADCLVETLGFAAWSIPYLSLVGVCFLVRDRIMYSRRYTSSNGDRFAYSR